MKCCEEPHSQFIFFVNHKNVGKACQNKPYLIGPFCRLSRKWSVMNKTYWAHSKVTKKMKCYGYDLRTLTRTMLVGNGHIYPGLIFEGKA